MKSSKSLYHRRRFPAEIISHCVWLYFRFSLSYRDVEEIMVARGVILTYETIRYWALKFGGNLRQKEEIKSSTTGRSLVPGRSILVN